jgi:hypothetical protein
VKADEDNAVFFSSLSEESSAYRWPIDLWMATWNQWTCLNVGSPE